MQTMRPKSPELKTSFLATRATALERETVAKNQEQLLVSPKSTKPAPNPRFSNIGPPLREFRGCGRAVLSKILENV